MAQDFDLDKLGKKMPYTRPADSPQRIEAGIYDSLGISAGEPSPTPKKYPSALRLVLSSALVAAVVALCFVLYPSLQPGEDSDSFAEVEQSFDSLSEDQQGYILSLYETWDEPTEMYDALTSEDMQGISI